MAEIWWQYARKTNFYTKFLFSVLETDYQIIYDIVNFRSLQRRLLFYKFLKSLTFGKTRQRLKEKRHDLKIRIKNVKKTLQKHHVIL